MPRKFTVANKNLSGFEQVGCHQAGLELKCLSLVEIMGLSSFWNSDWTEILKGIFFRPDPTV